MLRSRTKPITKSSLSRINEQQSSSLYEQLFAKIFTRCQPVFEKHKFKFKNLLYSMDASTIDLCLSVFPWARFRQAKSAIKLNVALNHSGFLSEFISVSDCKSHEVKAVKAVNFSKGSVVAVDLGYIDYDWFNQLSIQKIFFVTRIKSNMKYTVKKMQKFYKGKGVTTDQKIKLTSKNGQCYQGELRRIGYKDPATRKYYYFLTNNTKLAAPTIADIYKDRWQIELLLKWIKQNMKIKTFIGIRRSAVMT